MALLTHPRDALRRAPGRSFVALGQAYREALKEATLAIYAENVKHAYEAHEHNAPGSTASRPNFEDGRKLDESDINELVGTQAARANPQQAN